MELYFQGNFCMLLEVEYGRNRLLLGELYVYE